MDFRRSGLDERRRRVLRDELAHPTDEDGDAALSAPSGAPKGPVRAYAPAVLEERQLRFTDLLPVRPFRVALCILTALTAVAAIECCHIYLKTLPLDKFSDPLAALDVAQPGSIAAWFSSITLAGATVLSLVIFGIRLHRVDDYRGRYRMWLWTAAALAWASLDAATNLHNTIGLGLAHAAGRPLDPASLGAACTISWLALYGLVLGTLLIRLSIEVWQSLPAFATLAISALLYFLSSLAILEVLPHQSPLVATVVRTSLEMLAHVSLASALLLYARHVYLDAAGRLKVHIDPDKRRQTKKSRTRLKVVKADKEKEERESGDNRAAAAASANNKPAQPSQPIKFGTGTTSNLPKAGAAISKPSSSANYDDEDEDEDADDGDQRLSRAERRRLKKLARREQQQRRAA